MPGPPLVHALAQDDHVGDVAVGVEVEVLELELVAELLQLGEGPRDGQVQSLARLVDARLYDVVVPKLDAVRAKQCERGEHDEGYSEAPAEPTDVPLSGLGGVRQDHQRELGQQVDEGEGRRVGHDGGALHVAV